MGLSINSKKTSVIWYGAGKGYLKARQAHVVKHPRNGGSKHFVFATQHKKSFFPIVSKATYLGTCISYGNFEDLTMRMRLNASRANFNRLRLWLSKRHGVSRKMKLSIWRTCIVTCASYGIFYIGITDKGARQLCSMLMQQLRIMFGSPSHVTHQTDLELLNFFILSIHSHICLDCNPVPWNDIRKIFNGQILRISFINVISPLGSSPFTYLLDRLLVF